MPLKKRWLSLDRATVGKAPERWGMYELGSDGEIETIDSGVLRDELKTELAYSRAEQVRWEACQSREHAERLANEHRERAGLG
ncbi:hypothetical protein SAMN05421858_1481 [Haladaptatus litoreus]|uniref:DUF7508 domain-containing protein n=1 Tax=Haladaptatus litoreus TaxID=553468 RepID=A0A1N6YAI0_9EURY|nr:hypothetical protein [Haladaptatus litoreus]SIR11580.1 hypothetical protein SAMN05421858_1481 [Haladaptatus litoreus]